MNLILENLNKWAGKAEGLAGNVWGHCKYTRFFSFFSFPHIFLGLVFGVLCDLKSVSLGAPYLQHFIHACSHQVSLR